MYAKIFTFCMKQEQPDLDSPEDANSNLNVVPEDRAASSAFSK